MINTESSCGLFLRSDPPQAHRASLGRRETKFPLHHADVVALQRVLESNCVPVFYNHAVSTVRSVYYDDPRLTACRANLDGVGQRTKLRLRWYDSPWPQHDFFLEIKWRDNRMTGKERLHLGSTDCLSSLPFRELSLRLQRVIPHSFQSEVLRRTDPVALVEYKRRHYVSRDGGIRITLDYDLAFYDQTGRLMPCADWPVREPGLVVVEGKTPPNRHSELSSLLYPFSPRPGRSSKYVLACRTLGLIPRSDY